MVLNEQEAHCLARLIQSAAYGKDEGIFVGCNYCKYKCWQSEKNIAPRFNEICQKLGDETGVDLTPHQHGSLISRGFPYKKFLKNANEESKAYFRNFFRDI